MEQAKDTPREPVEYEVQEKSLVGNEIFEQGAKVMYAGLPAENLKPLCEVGEARYQEYLETNKARVAKMKEQNSESAVGDPAAFGAALSKALAEAQASQAEAIGAAVSAGIAAGIAQAMQAIAAQAPVAAPAADVAVSTTSTKGAGTKTTAGTKDSLV